MTTTADQLASVQAAIAAVESTGQAYTMPDGTMVRKADLLTLYQREAALRGRAAAEAGQGSGGGGLVRIPVSFGRPH